MSPCMCPLTPPCWLSLLFAAAAAAAAQLHLLLINIQLPNLSVCCARVCIMLLSAHRGAIEPHFYAKLLDGLGLSGEAPLLLPSQMDKSMWPSMKERFTRIFLTKTRDEWCARAAGGGDVQR